MIHWEKQQLDIFNEIGNGVSIIEKDRVLLSQPKSKKPWLKSK